MNILISVLVIFALCFVLQIFWFRNRLPQSQTKAILGLYSGFWLLYLMANLMSVFAEHPLFRVNLIEGVYLTLVFFPVLAIYVILYGLIEAESPSNLMILLIASSGAKGTRRADFEGFLNNDLLIWSRVREMQNGGYVRFEAGRYKITKSGILYMRFWLIPRFLIGWTQSGG
jgi:hypothetical protein